MKVSQALTDEFYSSLFKSKLISTVLFLLSITLHEKENTGWPRRRSSKKMLSKNSLINLAEKFEVWRLCWSITIWRNIFKKITNTYKIFDTKMSDMRGLRYTPEQCAFIIEHYFRTDSYKITQGRFENKFWKTPDPRTIKRIVEKFQTSYTLDDEPRFGRPYTLKENDWTKLREHVKENLGTSARRVAQELGLEWETVRTTLKGEGFYPHWIPMSNARTWTAILRSTYSVQ